MIQITNPDVEAMIDLRLRSVAFKDVEDVIMHALIGSSTPSSASKDRSIAEIFAAARGLGDDLDISRNPSYSRSVVLS